MHSCLICIGSNYNRKENLLLARRRLTALFPSIRFTGEQETRPLFFRNPALFSNQIARFYTDADAERVVKELKTIEREAELFVRRSQTGCDHGGCQSFYRGTFGWI